MSDAYTEFREALHEVQRETGLGAIRLGRLLGVSRDILILYYRRRSTERPRNLLDLLRVSGGVY